MSKATLTYMGWIEGESVNLTGSCTLLNLDNWHGKKLKIVIDAWMFQWWKWDHIENKKIDKEVLTADYIVLTHAHMDHSWRLPLVVKNGFKWVILMTHITRECIMVMLNDYVRLVRASIKEAEEKNKKKTLECKNHLRVKNLYEWMQLKWIDKSEKESLKKRLQKLLEWNDVKKAYESSLDYLSKFWIEAEKDIKNILEPIPELLYDEDDILMMSGYIKTMEIWEQNKLEKTIYILTMWSKYIDLLPEMVKNGYSKTVYIHPALKAQIKARWKQLLQVNWDKEAENKIIEKENVELRKKLETALEYFDLIQRWVSIDQELLKKHRDLLDMYRVKDSKDIEWALRPLHNITFTKNDMLSAEKLLKPDHGVINQKVVSNFIVQFLDAGHIEWSVQALISFTTLKTKDILEGNKPPLQTVEKEQLNLLFSWDLWRVKDPNLAWTPQIPDVPIDYYQLESTYAWRRHPEKKESIEKLFSAIRKAPWKVVIPAFSMQRTQEMLLLILERIQESVVIEKTLEEKIKKRKKLLKELNSLLWNARGWKKIQTSIVELDKEIELLKWKVFNYEIIVDSPLSNAISSIYLMNKWSKYRLLSPWIQESVFWKRIVKVLEHKQYKELYTRENRNKKQIVISASWMCQWWSVTNHLVENLENQLATIVFVWYTPPNTIGGQIKQGNSVLIDWVAYNVNCHVHDITWFSWHIDEEELLQHIWTTKMTKAWIIALTHGTHNRFELSTKVQEVIANVSKKAEVIVPDLWSTYTIKI